MGEKKTRKAEGEGRRFSNTNGYLVPPPIVVGPGPGTFARGAGSDLNQPPPPPSPPRYVVGPGQVQSNTPRGQLQGGPSWANNLGGADDCPGVVCIKKKWGPQQIKQTEGHCQKRGLRRTAGGGPKAWGHLKILI